MLRIYATSLELIRALRPTVDTIARFDTDLARQMRRAMASVTLNIAEGSYARGRNRQSLYQVALGSAKETRACLDVAASFGYLDEVDERVVADLGSICAVLYSLVT